MNEVFEKEYIAQITAAKKASDIRMAIKANAKIQQAKFEKAWSETFGNKSLSPKAYAFV